MCAVDVDCVPDASISRNARNIVLASKFGPRKGLEILPSIVEALPEYNFTALGRGWEEFINTTSLKAARNFKHIQLTKSTRNKHFSEAAIFLTLSNLEGGPVPLIEGIAMGCVPVATKTGFAPDIIRDGQNGFLLNIRPSVSEVCSKIMQASELDQSKDSLGLTWDRITSIMIKDMNAITARNKL
jgi:glycosyltransferase involved in cell wall biosynthesis